MREPSESQMKQIQAEIDAGRLIQAIRLYRLATGAGLKEAKDAVDGMAANRLPAFSSPPAQPGSPEDIMARAQKAIAEGRVFEAIKMIRQLSGEDLKAAKERVEAMAREQGMTPGSPKPVSLGANLPHASISAQPADEDLDALQRRLTGGGSSTTGGGIALRNSLLLLVIGFALYLAYLLMSPR